MSIWSVTSCTSIDHGRMRYDFPELHDLWLAQEKILERPENARGSEFPHESNALPLRCDHERTSNITGNQHHSAA